MSLAVVVLVWSLFVRLGLTTPNILTDGGSGFNRILSGAGSQGHVGITALMDLVLFNDARSDIWSAVFVTTTVAALTPPLVVLLARELGLPRRVGFLGGLALACLPLHAAMFSSDFVIGPAVAMMTAGLTLVAAGLRTTRASLMWAGSALLAYVCWLRPEGVLVAGIFLPVLWLHRQRLFKSTVGLLGPGWLVIHALTSFTAHVRSDQIGGGGGAAPNRILHFLSNHALSPISMSWFALAVVIGLYLVVKERPQGVVLVIGGTVLGLLPSLMLMSHDLTGNYMETFRYGAWSLPFMAIAAGFAFDKLAGGLSQVTFLAGDKEKRVTRACVVVAVLLVLIPLAHIPYLQRSYTHASESPILLEAFSLVPPECGVVVPEDDPKPEATQEIFELYSALSRGTIPLYGVVSFVESLGEQGHWPDTPPHGSGEPVTTVECWYFLEAAYCKHGYEDQPLEACAELLLRTEHELIREWTYEFLNFRQVVHLVLSQHGYDSSLRVALYRLKEPHPRSPESSSPE